MEYTIQANALEIQLAGDEKGLYLKQVKDKEDGIVFLSDPAPLFTVQAEKISEAKEIRLRSDLDFPEVSVREKNAIITVEAHSGEKLPGITVKLDILTDETCPRISFRTAVSSDSGDVSLICCDHPNLWFNVKDSVYFLSPYGCGNAMRADDEMFGHGYGSTQEYPSYGASFQYMAMWDTAVRKGIYYGMHDPAPAAKRFSFIRDTNAPVMCIKSSQPLENIGFSKNSQKLYGECVWQLFDGDWYDATLLYRDWMEKNAGWLPERTETGRKDSAWLEENDAWWLYHIRNDNFAEEILKAAEDLGEKSAVHLYLWHSNPFDNDYPHYFPEKSCVRSEIKKLQDAGIRIVPYINGRLWDTHDRENEDWQFTSKAKPSATKDRNGKIFTESYSSKEKDGSPVVLAVMCPSTELWKDTMKETTEKLFDDIGVDGIYMDQIAAAKPQQCEDPTHHHPAGGGIWWNEAYYELISRVKDGHPDQILATECTAEMFMKNIQGYLSWLWVMNNQVPAFPVLYSDKVHLFGISCGDTASVNIFIAQSLLFGEQMGWMSPERYWHLPNRDFYKKAVHTRAIFHDMLSHGVMLRPPMLRDDAPRIHSENAPHAYFHTVDYPAVQGAQWLEKETGKRVMFLANAQGENANTDIQTDFPDGDYTLHGDGKGILRIRSGKATVTLAGYDIVWVEK